MMNLLQGAGGLIDAHELQALYVASGPLALAIGAASFALSVHPSVWWARLLTISFIAIQMAWLQVFWKT